MALLRDRAAVAAPSAVGGAGLRQGSFLSGLSRANASGAGAALERLKKTVRSIPMAA